MSFTYRISMFDKDDQLINNIINDKLVYPEDDEKREDLAGSISNKFYKNIIHDFGHYELCEIDFDKFSKRIDEDESSKWVLTEDLLKEIIEYNRDKTEKYFKTLLNDKEFIKQYEYKPRMSLEERRLSEIESKISEFDKKSFYYNISHDDYVIIDSWLYEYETLNLVYFYKAVFLKNPDKLFILWGG